MQRFLSVMQVLWGFSLFLPSQPSFKIKNGEQEMINIHSISGTLDEYVLLSTEDQQIPLLTKFHYVEYLTFALM